MLLSFKHEFSEKGSVSGKISFYRLGTKKTLQEFPIYAMLQ